MKLRIMMDTLPDGPLITEEFFSSFCFNSFFLKFPFLFFGVGVPPVVCIIIFNSRFKRSISLSASCASLRFNLSSAIRCSFCLLSNSASKLLNSCDKKLSNVKYPLLILISINLIISYLFLF